MNSRAQIIFDKIEHQRKHVLSEVFKLSEEQFNRQPAPEKWSISQILTHLITSEMMSLQYMKKKSLGIKQLKDSGLLASLMFRLLQISQRIPQLKFRAPKVVLSNTPSPLSLQQVVQQWDVSRSELKVFLVAIPDQYIKRLIYKHPTAGRMNILQTMMFFREHAIHHWPQIKRLLYDN